MTSYQDRVEELEEKVEALEELPGHRNKYRVGQPVIGAIDGINIIFSTSNVFKAESLEVIFNGSTLTRNTDFNVTGSNLFQTAFIPPTGSLIRVNYVIDD